MGYSKNYIMYWGVFTVIIITRSADEVCTNFTKVAICFCASCILSKLSQQPTNFCVSTDLGSPLHANKKDSYERCLLGEGIFTMGYSKNYIMYWGVFTVIIIARSADEVCTNFTKVVICFCAQFTKVYIYTDFGSSLRVNRKSCGIPQPFPVKTELQTLLL